MKKFNRCPFCDYKELKMSKVRKKKIKGSGIVLATFDMWKCQGCGEEFFEHWTFKEIKTNNA